MSAVGDPVSASLTFCVLVFVGLLAQTAAARVFGAEKRIGLLAITVTLLHVVVGLLLLDLGFATESDAIGYHDSAVAIANAIANHQPLPELVAGKEGWPWVLTGTYLVGGPFVSLGVAVNAVILGFIPIVLHLCLKGLVEPRAAWYATLLVSASPAAWFWGSLPLREASTQLSIALFMLGILRVGARGGGVAAWSLLALGLSGAVVFRGSLAVIMAMTALVTLMVRRRRAQEAARKSPRSLLAVPVILAVGILGQSAYLASSGTLTSERAVEIRDAQSRSADTAFTTSDASSSSSTQDLLIDGVTTLPVAALRPWPWELPGMPLLAPMTMYWWLVLLLALKALRDPRARPILVPIGTFVLGLLMALAVYSGNFGTLVRLRDQLVLVIAPLVAIGLSRWLKPQESPAPVDFVLKAERR